MKSSGLSLYKFCCFGKCRYTGVVSVIGVVNIEISSFHEDGLYLQKMVMIRPVEKDGKCLRILE